MADYQLPDNPREPTDYEREIARDTLNEFSQLVIWRNVFASHWEEVARLGLPTSRNTFYFQSFNFPGLKKTEEQVDATAMMANMRHAAICDSLLTPRNMTWHGLEATDPQLMKIRRVRLYFEQLTRVLFSERYKPTANFAGQNHANYIQLGAFGTHAMYVDDFQDPYGRVNGLRYKSVPLGELFLRENHQGLIDGFIRWYRLTAQQAFREFGDALPAQLYPALRQNSQMPFNFLHRVCPRLDYNPRRLDAKAMPWASYHVCVESQSCVREGGYNSFPLAVGRYVQTPGEVYGRSWMMMLLPSMKTLNLEKKVFLKQGHRAVDPVLLTKDDGLIDGMSLRPGSLNKGGVDEQGREMVKVLPTGQIQIGKEMMEEERALINDGALVTLFQILTESPQMTATEVIERTNEKGILLAPTIGRQQSEYLGPLIEREVDLLVQQDRGRPANKRRLPPMPPELAEAGGEYQVIYTSPMSRSMRAQEAAGIQRTAEFAREMIAITQNPAWADRLNEDRTIQLIAEIHGVPPSVLSTDAEVAQAQKGRAKLQQQQAALQALPNQAAMVSARAKMMQAQSKSGGAGSAAMQPQQPPAQQPPPQSQFQQ